MKTILTMAITLALGTASDAFAGSAAWKRTPTDGDWNNPGNWLGDGPPNGAGDVATFNFSRLTDLFLSAPTTFGLACFWSPGRNRLDGYGPEWDPVVFRGHRDQQRHFLL